MNKYRISLLSFCLGMHVITPQLYATSNIKTVVKNNKKIIGTTVAFLIMATGMGGFYYWYARQNNKSEKNSVDSHSDEVLQDSRQVGDSSTTLRDNLVDILSQELPEPHNWTVQVTVKTRRIDVIFSGEEKLFGKNSARFKQTDYFTIFQNWATEQKVGKISKVSLQMNIENNENKKYQFTVTL